MTALRVLWFTMGFLLGLGIGLEARAADPYLCTLWARETTRINLVASEDPTIVNATYATIREMEQRAYSACLLYETERPVMPDVPARSSEEWAMSMLRLVQTPQGTVPAGDDDEWADACAAEWRSFNPEDGTVIRPRSKGGHQRCPLVLIDGEWRIPE